MYQRLDPPPTPPSIYEKMILGMSVSEKQGPFNSFRVVRGSQDFDTQVYESRVGQTKPCQVPKPEMGGPLNASTRCVDCNGRVYITTEHTREIFVYDFEKSRWSSLLNPCDRASNQPQHYCLDTLGVWNRRVFDVTFAFQTSHFRCGSWLMKRCTSGEYTTACPKTYQREKPASRPHRQPWFNMATKNWQKLHVEAGTIAIGEGYFSYDSSDLGIYANESSLDEFIMENDDDEMDSDSSWDFFLL